MLWEMAGLEDWDVQHILASVPEIVEMLGPPPKVHRVVESIEFLDESRVRRQVSVDVTVPTKIHACGSGHDVYLPLQVMVKAPIKNLDVTDGQGLVVPVLTAEQNGLLSGEVLIEQARRCLEKEPSEGIKTVLRAVATAREPTAHALEAILETLDEPDLDDFARLDGAPSVFVDPLWNGFLLVGQVRASAGDRVLIKRSYEEEFRMSGGCGNFTTEALFAGDSYHVELLAPEGTVIADSRMIVTVEGDAASRGRPYRHLVGFDSKVDRAHIYAKADVVAEDLGRDPTGALVEVWLRPRPPLIEPVLLVSVFVTAALISGAWAKHRGWITDVPNAAAVVVALPGLAAGYLASAGHRLTQRLLRGIRWAAFWVATASFGAAFALVMNPGKHRWHSASTSRALVFGVLLAVIAFWSPMRQVLAARCRVRKSGPAPRFLRKLVASSFGWLLSPVLIVLVAALVADNGIGGDFARRSYSPRTWLWCGFAAISSLCTLYLVLALLRAHWNSSRMPGAIRAWLTRQFKAGWTRVKGQFRAGWTRVKEQFKAGWTWVKGQFKAGWARVKGQFKAGWTWVKGLGKRESNADTAPDTAAGTASEADSQQGPTEPGVR